MFYDIGLTLFVCFCPAGRALLFVLTQRVNRKVKAEEKIAKKTSIPLKSMKLDLLLSIFKQH